MELYIPGVGDYEIDVEGESVYQEELASACGGRRRSGVHFRTVASLVPEDSGAVRAEINGKVIGRLSAYNANCYRTEMARVGYPNTTAVCDAIIVGGWDRGDGDVGMFGVKLDLP